MSSPLVVPSRFNGPPRSGNGGYVAGLLAARLTGPDDAAVTVTLRRPPPLAVALDVEENDGRLRLLHGTDLVAEAEVGTTDVRPVDPVPLEEAQAATSGYPGFVQHPFPTCFACGTEREDGLRIFPGPVTASLDGVPRFAAPWTPDPSLAEDLRSAAWAALDCIGGWAGDIENRPMVLGRMSAVLDALPRIGEPHVLVGLTRGSDGRKVHTSATLVDSDSRIVGRAEHTWIAVDPVAFSDLR